MKILRYETIRSCEDNLDLLSYRMESENTIKKNCLFDVKYQYFTKITPQNHNNVIKKSLIFRRAMVILIFSKKNIQAALSRLGCKNLYL